MKSDCTWNEAGAKAQIDWLRVKLVETKLAMQEAVLGSVECSRRLAEAERLLRYIGLNTASQKHRELIGSLLGDPLCAADQPSVCKTCRGTGRMTPYAIDEGDRPCPDCTADNSSCKVKK